MSTEGIVVLRKEFLLAQKIIVNYKNFLVIIIIIIIIIMMMMMMM